MKRIVIESVKAANGGHFDDGDIICVTEAVVAISQSNFVTDQDISDDIERKFSGSTELVIVDPIQSRNRFMDILKAILDLSEIMDESINGSGFNKDYGLYGSNKMAGGKLKLMPRDCQEFVERIQAIILRKYGKRVEVMVYGDGAFKDPVGGIWELADPTTTLGATSGLKGTPKEVKLKYIASANEGKTSEEIAAIVAEESAKRKKTEDLTGEASLGTTPRKITDLLASLADLTTGSGDRQTPVVYIKNYL